MPPAGTTVRRFTPTGVGTAFELFAELAMQFGSPPREWGQHVLQVVGDFFERFTPTGVGTARSRAICIASSRGSPPREWGQPDRVVDGL